MPKYIAKVKTNYGTRYFYDSATYDAYRRAASTVTNAQLNNVKVSNTVVGQHSIKPSKKQTANTAYRRSAETITNAQLNNVNASNAFNNTVAGQHKIKPVTKQSKNVAQKVSDAKRVKQALHKLPKNDLMRRIKRTLHKRATRKQQAMKAEKTLRSHTTMGKANKIASDIIPGAKYHVTTRAVLGSTSKTPKLATKQAVNNSARATAPYRIKKHK